MKENLTEIVYIMDESGSMNYIKKDVIGGFNSFIEEQKQNDGEANLTAIFFANEYRLFLDAKDIKQVNSITNKDYLLALNKLVNASSVENDTIKLSKEQILMLQLSDNDIKNGRLISQSQLDKSDLQWLKEM